MSADRTSNLTRHARRRHEQTLQRAHDALAAIAKNGDPATVGLLASKAGVSRSWIYTQPELRDRIERLQQKRARTSSRTGRTSSRASEESLRRRLTLAHQRIAQLRTENQQLRDELARAHGELRATRTDARPPGVKQTKTRG